MPEVHETELHHVLHALEAAEVQLQQLEYDNEWFVSDTTDLLISAKEILMGHLGMLPNQEDEEHD
jgi:hypothetical protein